jgi:hypothetical protein
MSRNGVILQHRAELIAYLFVDRGDDLLIGNHIKSLSLTTGDCNWENNRNLLRSGVNVWTDCGQAALFCQSDFFTRFLSFFLACLPLGFVETIATLRAFLRGG